MAAGNIKQAVVPAKMSMIDGSRPVRPIESEESEWLKNRTAGRAEFDEDDPFPYVASLPRKRSRQAGEDQTKENH
jgi:hypothetical protein